MGLTRGAIEAFECLARQEPNTSALQLARKDDFLDAAMCRTCVNDRDWLFGHVDFLEINDLESVDAVQPIPKAHR